MIALPLANFHRNGREVGAPRTGDGDAPGAEDAGGAAHSARRPSAPAGSSLPSGGAAGSSRISSTEEFLYRRSMLKSQNSASFGRNMIQQQYLVFDHT